MDYKEQYEQEHLRNADLAGRVAELEAKVDDLNFKLERIKTNPVWKASAPLRKCMHFTIRQARRVKNCGSIKGIAHKVKYKKNEKIAMEQFGTKSFPNEEQRKLESETVFPYMAKISILVPLYNTPEQFLKEMIDSVVNQTYSNWELCLADGSDQEHSYVATIVKEYQNRLNTKNNTCIVYEKLAKNEGISGNTNQCLKLATGDYIGLFDHDDILHPSVLFEYVKAINEKNADYIYCDETTFKSGNIDKMLTMHFKPDYAIDNLRANNYICHFSVFKKELLEGDELFRSQFDGSQDHDMILRLTDKAKNIVHVPRLMYYWRCHEGSVASNIDAKPYAIEAAKGAVADHLRRHGYDHFKITSTRAFETIFKIRYEIIGTPKISIIIPNKDHIDDLKRCINSILEKSTYDNYEIIVVENNSKENTTFEYYKQIAENSKITVVTYTPEEGETFNYSKVNNYGVSFAKGEYVLLLNNDTEVITVNWIEELLMYAQREDVACVGAKLYYPNKTIQHAGVVLKLGAHRTAGHSHYMQHRENLGYMGRLCYTQDVSAVTGACLLVKKAIYDEVGGLGEDFAISLNDVDFCLKARQKGYLNVFTPFAELFHYESASRGSDMTGDNADRYNKESEYFRNKWKEVLDAGDPYYNPNFSLDKSDFSLRI
ncbi:MAG: glycosyltransferase family 2 protein [Lachnospiraceae bacterium]|nr:glycosyltransferase family 2 protein [Lachnospiraceae bacterium]